MTTKKPHRSKIHRRSGNAVVGYCQLIGFEPNAVVLVGVGMRHQEIEVMREDWDDFELYGFEPNPDIHKAINHDFPGFLSSSAITDVSGLTTLHVNRAHKDGSCIYKKFDEKVQAKTKQVEVFTTTLDGRFSRGMTFGKNIRVLLWLDCEGCENLALKGGQKLIKRNVDLINVELTGKPRNHGWPKPIEVHKLLLDLGFLQCWVHTTRSCIGQYDAIYIRKELFRPEFCSCPDSIERFENDNQ